MKQSILNKFLLAGLVFISMCGIYGCGDKSVKVVPPVIETTPEIFFAPEYYIYKRPETDDFSALERLKDSDNLTIAAEASLILGYYYLREGRLDEADSLISAYHSNPLMSQYMRRLGELLSMEVSLQKEDVLTALMRAEQIKSRLDESSTLEALHTYCNIMRLYPDAQTGPLSCLEERLADFMPVVEPDSTPYLSGTLNILVISIKDVSSAIAYYAGEHNMNHKVRMEKSFVEGDWDFILDINSGYLAGRGYNISFMPDISSTLIDMEYYAGLNTCGRIALGIGGGLLDAAKKLEQILIDSGNIVNIIKITDAQSAMAGIRQHLEQWEKVPYCVVGAGAEEEINYFIPSVRQYGTRQKYFIVETLDTGKHYTAAYRPYYKEAIVFPSVDLTLSGYIQDEAAKYKNFTNSELTFEAMMAYDMMHYIYTQTEEGKDLGEPYLTNIIGVEDGKVVRPIRAFYIPAKGEAEELVLSADE